MSEFAALITGSIAGALMKAEHLLIEVGMPTDGEGNYLKEVHVRGKESGEWLKITVSPMYDTPESVEAKMIQARQVYDSAKEHLGGVGYPDP